MITAGNEVVHLARLVRPGETSYRAEDVVNYLRAQKIAIAV
jgi:hypothetical protein